MGSSQDHFGGTCLEGIVGPVDITSLVVSGLEEEAGVVVLFLDDTGSRKGAIDGEGFPVPDSDFDGFWD